MRIPPNPHPVIRITLAIVTALLTIWFLRGLAACAVPTTESTAATRRPSKQGSHGLHEAVTRFAPTGPIPLAIPLAPMHQRTGWRV